MNSKDKMNNVDTEVDEAEILEAEVVESSRSARSGILPGVALILALTALILAVGSALFNYQGQQSLSADAAADKQKLEAVQQQTVELSQQLQAAHDSYQAQGKQLIEQKQALADQQLVLAEQQRALEQHKQLLADQDAKLDQERARLELASEEIANAVKSLHQRVGGDNSRWMASEAAYLIQVANHRLHLEWDIATAINALETADTRLRDSGDPSWIPVREVLAQEIASLRGTALADIEGLTLKLAGLANGVNELKLRGTKWVQAETVEGSGAVSGTAAESQERSFQTLLEDAWEGFKSIMVIRHHGQPVSALLPPDQQLFIQQNLRLQLEAARVSLLRGNQALFNSSLQTAQQLVHEYFDTEDAKAAAFLKELDSLAALSVRPQMPDISKSLLLLRELLKKEGDN